MKQYIYKIIIFIVATIMIYEFTIGKQINKYTNKLNTVSSKGYPGRYNPGIREEIKKVFPKLEFI